MQGREWVLFLIGRGPQSPRNRRLLSYWDRIVIIVAIVAVTVAVLLVPGTYTLGNTLEGFVLLMTLYASDRPDDSPYECISFSGAWALCVILIVGIILINPIILLFNPFIFRSLDVVGTSAQDIVGGQITDGFTLLLALLLGVPMARYRLHLLAERQKKGSTTSAGSNKAGARTDRAKADKE